MAKEHPQGPSTGTLIAIVMLIVISLVAVKWSSNLHAPTMCARAMSDPSHASTETLDECAAAAVRH